METDSYYEFCRSLYQNEYNKTMESLRNEHGNRRISPNIIVEWEKKAQKSAIRYSIIEGMRHFKNPIVEELWNAIYRVHLFQKSSINDLNTINKVISADQSWKKTSGHAFEEMVKELSNIALSGTNIEIILQRDLNILIKMDELSNEPRDISWLKEQIKSSIFDLYAIVSVDGKKKCFGCIQSKTSVRDRVTRDREPSIHAMESYFWSIAFVLDGAFLKMPKFQYMVNGGSKEFPQNGWHGLYALSAQTPLNRIYPLSIDFDLFCKHAQQAAKQWIEQRQWFNNEWQAE